MKEYTISDSTVTLYKTNPETNLDENIFYVWAENSNKTIFFDFFFDRLEAINCYWKNAKDMDDAVIHIQFGEYAL